MFGVNASPLDNDVWASMDQGRTWRQHNKAAPFHARYAQIAFNVKNPLGTSLDQWGQPVGNTDIMYVIAGQAAHDNLNDVWATSDEGRTWAVISAAGPFPQRHLASGAATKSGLMVIVAGYADTEPGAPPTSRDSIQNDV